MKTKDICKITDECKLCGVGYDEGEDVSYKITQFNDGGYGFIETISGVRKEHLCGEKTTSRAILALNEYLNGKRIDQPPMAQEIPKKETKEEGMASTRSGMTVEEGKVYLENRGLTIGGGWENIQRMQRKDP